MKTVPFPKFDHLEDEAHDKALDEFHENVGKADWKEAPMSVLQTVDRMLREHGLEVRVYNALADSVFFDIVAK